MKKRNTTSKMDSTRLVCLTFFIIEIIIIVLCYFIESSSWQNTIAITAAYAKIFTGCCMLCILSLSFLVCIYFRNLSLDKKILILLGLLSIALGILGISGLVFKNEISFIDAIYKSFQLFVGEFGEVSYKVGTFPVLLNISRFLALFVTFGAITILILKEKLYYLSIRLFYKDIIIITDNINQLATSLIDKMVCKGHKVIVGLIDSKNNTSNSTDGNVPFIDIDMEKHLSTDLLRCNIKKAKCIYLMCDETSLNLKLFRNIQLLLPDIGEEQLEKPGTRQFQEKKSSNKELADEFISIINSRRSPFVSTASKVSKKVICYIQYQNDTERDFYSMDEHLIKRSDSIETYFINITDNAIRQMLNEISLKRVSGFKKVSDSQTSLDNLKRVKIGVAGSGNLLMRTIYEISRIFVFDIKTPLEIYLLNSDSEPTFKNKKLYDLIKFKNTSINELSKSDIKIDLLFISSTSEIDIKNLLYLIFQNNLNDCIKEFLVLTEGNNTEFKILQKFISSLTAPYRNKITSGSDSVINLANTVDLAFTIDDFYNKYGPTSREIHKAYLSAMKSGIMIDFNKLPETLTESNLLNSIHNKLILDYLIDLPLSAGVDYYSLIEFFAACEHERWFNERYLQNFIYSEKQDYLLNKNSSLLHWNHLSETKKDSNIRYVIKSLMTQYERNLSENDSMYMPLIYKYHLNFKKGAEQ